MLMFGVNSQCRAWTNSWTTFLPFNNGNNNDHKSRFPLATLKMYSSCHL